MGQKLITAPFIVDDSTGVVLGVRNGDTEYFFPVYTRDSAGAMAQATGAATAAALAHVGAVSTAATTGVVEYGDGYRHTTKLTLTDFAVGTSADDAAKAIGAALYVLPAGAVIVESAYLSVGLTLADAVQTDTPEIGLGNAAASGGANATLGADGATKENIWEGAATADVAGTAKVGTKIPTAAVPLVIESGGGHTIYLNAAATWANLTAASALTATGTVIINWRFVA